MEHLLEAFWSAGGNVDGEGMLCIEYFVAFAC
jgi:hypothetical protein